MLKLKEFAIIIRTIGIIILFALLVLEVVAIPFFIIVMITVGYLCSAVSCVAPLFSPSVEHHKIVNYFIASLGIIVIAKHIINAAA